MTHLSICRSVGRTFLCTTLLGTSQCRVTCLRLEEIDTTTTIFSTPECAPEKYRVSRNYFDGIKRFASITISTIILNSIYTDEGFDETRISVNYVKCK